MKNFLLCTVFLLAASGANSQQLYFGPATSIPLRDFSGDLQQNAWAGGINFPIWSSIDLDGDGLMDLFMYDKSNDRVCTFLNDGSAGPGAFHYAPQFVSRFPAIRPDGWGMCYDYNCDGKADFFALDSLYNGIEVWRNDFTIPTGLTFTKVSSELLEDWSGPAPINVYATSIYLPALSDIDNDGDMDILCFNNPANGKFAYHRNRSMDMYGTCDSLDFVFDDKCWGNFTLSIGTNSVSTFHNAPCGTPGPRDPGQNGYETARRDDTITTVSVLDLDGDGAKELLIGDQASPNCLMVHNGGTAQNAEMDNSDTSFPSYNVPVDIYDYVHNAYIDVDNDGKRDLLSSSGQLSDKQGVWYYKNTNTDASPLFSLQKTDFLQNEMLETGQAACPVFFDYNADGLMDLVVAHGEYKVSVPGIVSRLSLYKNIGSASSPSFQLINEDYASLSNYNLFFPIVATFGDLDNDNDVDMIIGDFAGYVHYFSNSAGPGNTANLQLTTPQYMGIDVGNNATPQLVDMDYDGLLDLVIGKQTGTFNYYRNIGSSSNPFFSPTPTIDTLGNIRLAQIGVFSGYSVPFVFTHNAHHQMLTANMHGDIYYYDNIDNNLNGTFTCIDTLVTGQFGRRASGFNLFVSGGDINNDNLVDMLVGFYSGGAQIYYGSMLPIAVPETESNETLHCFPNPASSTFTLNTGLTGTTAVTLYNVLGECVLTKTVQSGTREMQLDVSGLPSGIYVVTATYGKGILRDKIIISR